MTWTKHGHQIPDTTVDDNNRPVIVERCGGVRLCHDCMKEVAERWNTTELNATQTVLKVFNALVKAGISHQQGLDAIDSMQNSGILFRERV